VTPLALAGRGPLQGESLVAQLPTAAAEVLGLSLVAGVLAALVALVYRWYVNERVPSGLPILVGLSGVALYLGSSRALKQVIGNTGDPFDEMTALANIVTFLVALAAARLGTDMGDRVGTDVFVATGATQVESEVSRVVQAVGRVITVEIPDEVDDIVGYDPVPDETKAKLEGKTFVFPRRLTVAELRERLVTRLKADYAVGHVDIELAADGTVDYLAVGSRAAGIGPTLPPETSAVAVRADPAFAASAGDLVQVWRSDPVERVLTAEVRATADDVVTLAVDAADTRKLDAGERYKLVTLPVETRPDREFVSLLRAADETMAAVTVAAGSPLVGQPTGALDVSVVAVRPAEGPVEPLPGRDRALRGGDTLYLVATPEAIRKVEAAASGPAEPDGPPDGGAELPPEDRVDAGRAVGAGSDGSPADATSDAAAPSETAAAPASTEPEATEATESEVDEAPESEAETATEAESEETAAVTETADTAPSGKEAQDSDAAESLGDPDLVDLDGDSADEKNEASTDEEGTDETDAGGQWTTVSEESDEDGDGEDDDGTGESNDGKRSGDE